jgi:hypothetical protein
MNFGTLLPLSLLGAALLWLTLNRRRTSLAGVPQ